MKTLRNALYLFWLPILRGRGITLLPALVLVLAASSAHATSDVIVKGPNTSGGALSTVNTTTVGGVVNLRVMTVPAPGPGGTVDATSRGTTNATSQFTILAGATASVAALATRRAITFTPSPANLGIVRIGGTGTTVAIGNQITPGSSASFDSSAAASWIMANPNAVAVVVDVTEERD